MAAASGGFFTAQPAIVATSPVATRAAIDRSRRRAVKRRRAIVPSFSGD
jgi:hypothetical protein